VIIAGVDPGTSPTIAVLDSESGRISIYDELSATLKVNGRNTSQPVPELIAFALSESGAELVLIEHVWMRPVRGPQAQGAVSQARLVASMHLVWGVACGLGLRVELVVPGNWKRHFRLRGGAKEDSRLKCLSIMPAAAKFLTRKMDHNRAESLLLARYGIETYQGSAAA
jgi:crossover junction endodeoxyribonuclease RuvC